MAQNLNAELDRPLRVDTQAMDWAPSPSGTVWRKRVHRAGPEEAGQVTSVVRYEPQAAFPTHDHPDGEEILVLDGVFSDEHGDWPAGSYLLHPEGFRHNPFSKPGCLLFVKLRQYPGARRQYVTCQIDELPWQAGEDDGVERKCLYRQDGFSDETWLERWAPGTEVAGRAYPQGAEIFVIEGALDTDQGELNTHAWMRLPSGSVLHATSEQGCTLYIKRGGLGYLHAGSA